MFFSPNVYQCLYGCIKLHCKWRWCKVVLGFIPRAAVKHPASYTGTHEDTGNAFHIERNWNFFWTLSRLDASCCGRNASCIMHQWIKLWFHCSKVQAPLKWAPDELKSKTYAVSFFTSTFLRSLWTTVQRWHVTGGIGHSHRSILKNMFLRIGADAWW